MWECCREWLASQMSHHRTVPQPAGSTLYYMRRHRKSEGSALHWLISHLVEAASQIRSRRMCGRHSGCISVFFVLTNSWFDHDGARLVWISAVSSSAYRLHPEHVFPASLQAVDCKPENIRSVRILLLTTSFYPTKVSYSDLVLTTGLLLTVFQSCLPASL